jgi:hypothetical protein
MHLGRIEFNIVLFMDWSFASACSPPRLSTTQLPSATDRQVLLSDRDFHPTIGAYFQAHPCGRFPAVTSAPNGAAFSRAEIKRTPFCLRRSTTVRSGDAPMFLAMHRQERHDCVQKRRQSQQPIVSCLHFTRHSCLSWSNSRHQSREQRSGMKQ